MARKTSKIAQPKRSLKEIICTEPVFLVGVIALLIVLAVVIMSTRKDAYGEDVIRSMESGPVVYDTTGLKLEALGYKKTMLEERGERIKAQNQLQQEEMNRALTEYAKTLQEIQDLKAKRAKR